MGHNPYANQNLRGKHQLLTLPPAQDFYRTHNRKPSKCNKQAKANLQKKATLHAFATSSDSHQMTLKLRTQTTTAEEVTDDTSCKLLSTRQHLLLALLATTLSCEFAPLCCFLKQLCASFIPFVPISGCVAHPFAPLEPHFVATGVPVSQLKTR